MVRPYLTSKIGTTGSFFFHAPIIFCVVANGTPVTYHIDKRSSALLMVI